MHEAQRYISHEHNKEYGKERRIVWEKKNNSKKMKGAREEGSKRWGKNNAQAEKSSR